VLGFFYGTTQHGQEKTTLLANSTPIKPCA
jgi:hypothetical protein